MKYLDLALDILKKLNNFSFEAYIVGGFVRDRLLNIESYDLDISTSATLDDIKAIFKDAISTGDAYGGVTILKEGYKFEITSFRKDINYKDHRHPIVKHTNNLLDDLNRRDFTINSMLLDSNLKLIDHLNGLDDLNNKIIRVIGNPNLRFNEDALRILRAYYFEAKLGFDIEADTKKAMDESSIYLENISSEMVLRELSKLLNGKYHKKALKDMLQGKSLDYLHNLKKSISIVVENDINCDIIDLLIISKYFKEDVSYYKLSKRYASYIDLISNNLGKKLSNLEVFNLGLENLKKIDELNSSLKLMNSNYQSKFLSFEIKTKKDLCINAKILKEKLNISDKEISQYLNESLGAILDGVVANDLESIIIFLKRGHKNGK